MIFHDSASLHKLCQPASLAVGKWRENEKMERKWRENEKLEKYSLSTFPHFLFTPSLPISFCLKVLNSALLSRMWPKNLTYALWENNSGSNLLWKSTASCEGLDLYIYVLFALSHYPSRYPNFFASTRPVQSRSQKPLPVGPWRTESHRNWKAKVSI